MARLASTAALLLAVTPGASAAELRGVVFLNGLPAAARIEAYAIPDPLETARGEARGAGATPLAASVADADGRFRVPLTGDHAVVELRVRATGGVPLRARVPLEGATTDLPGIHLAAGRRLAGRVIDASGAPLGGVVVELRAGGDAPAERSLTDATGRFAFAAAARVGNRLRFEALGLATTGLEAGEGDLAKPVTLVPGTAVTGRVRRPDGAPAPGTLVRFEPAGEGAAPSRWSESDAEGRFALEDLGSGAGALVALGDDGVASLALTLPPRESAPLELRLGDGARVAGRVVSRSGEALAGVTLVARTDRGEHVIASGARGYAFAPLLPGHLFLEVEDPRFTPLARAIEALVLGETRQVDLVLVRAARIAGLVVDAAGDPVAGAGGRVRQGRGFGRRFARALARGGGRGDAADFVTGPDGRFRAGRLEPGEALRLTVDHPAHGPAELGLALAPGEAVEDLRVTLPEGVTAFGSVVDDRDRPVAGATVQAFPLAPGRGGFRGGPRGGVNREAQADAGGAFALTGLSPGTWMLRAEAAGYGAATLGPVELPDDGEPLTVVLTPGVSIAGRVLQAEGDPAPGVLVVALPETPGGLRFRGPRRPEPSDADGGFRIDGLEDGVRYRLQAAGGRGPGAPPLATVAAPASDVELRLPPRSRIEGRVVEAETGLPVTRYRIRAFPDGSGPPGFGGGRFGGVAAEVADPDGAFVLEGVGEGTWSLRVEAEDRPAADRDGIEVAAGAPVTGVEIRLRRGARVEGRVIDGRSRQPVPGAAIRLEPASGRGSRDAGPSTDAEGRFAVAGLRPGLWQVTAQHPDYTDVSERVDTTDGDARVELEMRTGALVSGVVLSPDGGPLAGAEVVLTPAGGDRFDRRSGLTDGLGSFRFRNLGAGRYELSASQRHLFSEAQPLALLEGEAREGLVLQLAGGAVLDVRVSGLRPEELAGATVQASGPEGYRVGAPLGADGRARLHGAPSGPVDVSATAFGEGVRTVRTQVTVEPGQLDVPVELRFGEGALLQGRVTRAGEAVPGARVVAVAPGRGGRLGMGTTDADGLYAIRDLAPDLYEVRVESVTREVQVDGATRLDVALPTARLQGVVVDAADGSPIAGAEVEGWPPGVEPGDRTPGTRTDSEGRFDLAPLEPGAWTLSVTRPGYEAARVEATASDAPRLVTVELTPGAGLALRVFDALLGAPLRGVRVQARDGAGLSVFDGPLALDDAGRGEIPSLAPGSWRLRVQAGGYAPVELPASVPSSPLEVGLTPGGSLELRAGPETLSALPTECRLLRPDGAPQPVAGADHGGAFTLRAPALRLDHVAPGRYRLVTAAGAAVDAVVIEGQLRLLALP